MATRYIAVAWSGGRDSTALLHATAAAASGAGVQVLALHVHHGLSPNADAWQGFCERTARRWASRGLPVTLHTTRLAGRPAAGDSLEAWARDQRYAALAAMARAHGADTVLLAHHRRDQAETWLLQALRGAGPAGLAAMPRCVERAGIRWVRPWLLQSPEAIAAYVRRYRLRHVEDESNADVRLARNRLRLQVWPALEAAFAGAEAALADSAAWAGEAALCLGELAELDLAEARDGDGLRLAALHALSPARQHNAWRAWLHERTGQAPPASLMQRLARELDRASTGRWPLGAGELRLYRGRLDVVGAAVASSVAREASLAVHAPGRYALPGWGGALVVERVEEGGVPLAMLGRLELRERAGAERFQAGPGRPPRSLKKQFQAAALPAWQRRGPLLWRGEELVFVPGLGLDARVLVWPGAPRVSLAWLTPA